MTSPKKIPKHSPSPTPHPFPPYIQYQTQTQLDPFSINISVNTNTNTTSPPHDSPSLNYTNTTHYFTLISPRYQNTKT